MSLRSRIGNITSTRLLRLRVIQSALPQEDFVIPAVMETIDAAMFQIPSDDTSHANVFAHPWDPGAKRTDAPHQQFDLHACS